METFTPQSVRLAGTITLHGPVEDVFPLFSPLGETRWVPGWEPELLHPPGAVWEEGLLFRTQEDTGPALWIVTRLDRSAHKVAYYRVEPQRYVAHITVRCVAAAGGTKATTAYTFVGLSAAGNAEIAAMTQDAYAEKMAGWGRWINAYLAAQGGHEAP